jgi:predicted nucleic acid-binding protein
MAVIDANAAVALVVDLPWSSEARAILLEDPDPIAPSLFVAEVTNALWQYCRTGLLATETAALGLTQIKSLIDVTPDAPLAQSALTIAASHNHPAYDCFYLALAIREKTALLTADRKLASLGQKLAVKVQLLL